MSQTDIALGLGYMLAANVLKNGVETNNQNTAKRTSKIPKPVKIVHNSLLIVFNAFIVISIIRYLKSPDQLRTHLTYFYYSKFWDFIDTIILVDQGKYQAWWLHVFHHASIPFILHRSILRDQSSTWVVSLINSSIHVIMYSYYLATMVLPEGPKKVLRRFGRYITKVQMTQFVVSIGIGLATSQGFVDKAIYASYPLILLFLFYNFDRKRKVA